MYKLYGKLDSNKIIELKMSWQQNDWTGYEQLLETEDRHEVNNYILTNFDGVYLLKYINGEIVNRLQSEVDTERLPSLKYARLTNFGTLVTSKVEEGFTVNVNGKDEKFGSSELDQSNWNSSIAFNDQEDYPLLEEVKNWEGEYVVIADPATNKAIAKAGKARVNSYRKKFYTFKKAVMNTAIDTIEKLNAILDEDYI